MSEVGCVKITHIDDFFGSNDTMIIPRNFETDKEPKSVGFSRSW